MSHEPRPPHPPRRPVIVAGYDGSDASRAAVEAAIDRTGERGQLIVVHAFEVPPDFVGAPHYQLMLDSQLDYANAVMDDLARECEGLGSVHWEPDVVFGAPGEVIARVAAARGADEIVVGTRGHGRMRALLGSVSLDVLHRATCPVLVIPQRAVVGTAREAPAGAAAA